MTRQLKITLGDDLREWLDKATAVSGNSLAEEIRQRLEWSSFRDASDAVTQELLEFVARLDTQLLLETGYRWHKHAGVNEAFATALYVRATRLIQDRVKEVAFEVNTEPFEGKTISTEDEQQEYGRMIEWIDARVYRLASPFGAERGSREIAAKDDRDPATKSAADKLPIPKKVKRARRSR